MMKIKRANCNEVEEGSVSVIKYISKGIRTHRGDDMRRQARRSTQYIRSSGIGTTGRRVQYVQQ